MEDLDVGWGVVSFLAREDGRHHTTIGLGLGLGLACCAPGCRGRRATAPRGSHPRVSYDHGPRIHGVGVHLGGQERCGGARHQAAGGAGGSG